jgi:hypothetical protein
MTLMYVIGGQFRPVAYVRNRVNGPRITDEGRLYEYFISAYREHVPYERRYNFVSFVIVIIVSFVNHLILELTSK